MQHCALFMYFQSLLSYIGIMSNFMSFRIHCHILDYLVGTIFGICLYIQITTVFLRQLSKVSLARQNNRLSHNVQQSTSSESTLSSSVATFFCQTT